MAVTIQLDPADEAILRDIAAQNQQTPEQYLTAIVQRSIWFRKRWDEITAPLAEDFKKSGMTDDELSDLINEEIHAMRAERRAAVK